MAKATKTQMELAVAVMNKIREHPELAREIFGVQIRRAERHNPAVPNWDAVFQMAGNDSTGRPVPMPIPHPLAYKIVSEIQSKFDLA